MNSSLYLKSFLLLLAVVFCAAGDPIRAIPRASWSIADFPTARPVQLTNAAISSQYDPPHPAADAIDGSLTTFTHTSSQYEAWFQVNTVSPTIVSQIVIYNRQDCCQDRLNPGFVFIKATAFIGTTVSQLLQEPGVTPAYIDTDAAVYTIDYQNVQTSYVLVMLGATDILNFAEIFVLTNAAPAEIEGAEMSSDYPASPHPASEAVDGNVNTFCHTNFGYRQWLKVNLQQSVNAVQVEVVNRLDSCCRFRIVPGYLFMKNTPFIGDTIDELQSEPGVTTRLFLETKDYYNFYFDSSLPVTYLWIFQYSSTEPLNIAEVYVF